jgi:hypothetical protein
LVDPAFSIGLRNAGRGSDQPHQVGTIIRCNPLPAGCSEQNPSSLGTAVTKVTSRRPPLCPEQAIQFIGYERLTRKSPTEK